VTVIVGADLAIGSEAATVTALRLAGAYDRRASDGREAAFDGVREAGSRRTVRRERQAAMPA